MTQDALRRLTLAIIVSTLAAGCTTPSKTKPATRPLQVHQAPAAVKPANTALSTSPARAPIVNTQNMTAPPPVVLPTTPGVSSGGISAPTMPSTSSAAPREGTLPITPPVPPEIGGNVTVPISTPIEMPMLK